MVWGGTKSGSLHSREWQCKGFAEALNFDYPPAANDSQLTATNSSLYNSLLSVQLRATILLTQFKIAVYRISLEKAGEEQVNVDEERGE